MRRLRRKPAAKQADGNNKYTKRTKKNKKTKNGKTFNLAPEERKTPKKTTSKKRIFKKRDVFVKKTRKIPSQNKKGKKLPNLHSDHSPPALAVRFSRGKKRSPYETRGL